MPKAAAPIDAGLPVAEFFPRSSMRRVRRRGGRSSWSRGSGASWRSSRGSTPTAGGCSSAACSASHAGTARVRSPPAWPCMSFSRPRMSRTSSSPQAPATRRGSSSSTPVAFVERGPLAELLNVGRHEIRNPANGVSFDRFGGRVRRPRLESLGGDRRRVARLADAEAGGAVGCARHGHPQAARRLLARDHDRRARKAHCSAACTRRCWMRSSSTRSRGWCGGGTSSTAPSLPVRGARGGRCRRRGPLEAGEPPLARDRAGAAQATELALDVSEHVRAAAPERLGGARPRTLDPRAA